MPARPDGVYSDGRGGWYFKLWLPADPLTGKRSQVTKRGFKTAAEAGRARRDMLGQADAGLIRSSSAGLSVNDLMDLYLDGLDADGNLSAKSRFDYRNYTDSYIRPLLGTKRVRDLTSETILTWQRRLAKSGGTKDGKPLAANTIRLARSPLSGAFKLAVAAGMVPVNPLLQAPRPKARRSVPKHWTPEQAREFLTLMEGDRTWPLWAFLLGAGLRIGELDDGLAEVLRRQRALQAAEQLAAVNWTPTEYVFTKPAGGSYHP